MEAGMTRRIDTAEALTNATIGLALSVLAVQALWRLADREAAE